MIDRDLPVPDISPKTSLFNHDDIPVPYGEDQTTYRAADRFLADCEYVEDWGCGRGWFRQYIEPPRRYLGVDMGVDSVPRPASPFADVIADLRDYTSTCDGILMRHSLDHNFEWRPIVANACASARHKVCIVTFCPWAEETHAIEGMTWSDTTIAPDPVPWISFAKADLLEAFGDEWDIEVIECITKLVYGNEHVLCATRKERAPL